LRGGESFGFYCTVLDKKLAIVMRDFKKMRMMKRREKGKEVE
jgi:hypothetical protein